MVREGQVDGLVAEGECEPDEARAHRVFAAADAIQTDQRQRFDFQQQIPELILGEDRAIAPLLQRRRWRRGCFSERGVLDFLQPGLEAVAIVLRALARRVALALAKLIESERQRDIALHGEELARLRQPVLHLAQVLAGEPADLIGLRDHALERAVLHDPLARGLRSDLVDARDVVDLIADQGEVVHDPVRRHAELGLDAFHVQLFIGHGVDPQRAFVHELRQVLVAGRDHGAPAAFRRLVGERRDHVVGFHALDGEERPAERLDRLVERLDLAREVVGHGGARRLVVGIHLVAKGPALGVEHGGARLRLVVGGELP